MRTVSRMLVLSVMGVLAACDAGARPEDRAVDCMTAVHQIVSIAQPDPPPKVQVIRNQIVARCEEDKWSTGATKCMEKARSGSEMLECRRQHLTVAQDEVLARLIDSLQETPAEAVGAAMVAMENFSAGMCACHDPACATQISDAMTRWSSEQQKKSPPPMSADETQHFAELGRKMNECMYRATHDGAPPPLCDEVSCVLNNYEGECCAQYIHGNHRPRNSDLATGLTRSLISEAVADVKPAIMACGDKTDAHGKVKLKVKVSPAGKVTSVEVATTPDPALGECVAAAMKQATFGTTEVGGSFSYPFIF